MSDSPPATLPDFTPVHRQTVSHGWTVAKQRDFIAGLAETGSVRLATEACGMSHCGVYKLRHAKDGGSFARAWDIAVGMGAARIRDVLFDHAIHGVPETVVHGGERIERRKFNHRTMIWALQHHMPDEYPGGSTLRRVRDPEAEGYIKLTPELVAEARATIEKRVMAIKAGRVRLAATNKAP